MMCHLGHLGVLFGSLLSFFSSSEDLWSRCSSPCQFEGNVPLNLIGSGTACCCASDMVILKLYAVKERWDRW